MKIKHIAITTIVASIVILSLVLAYSYQNAIDKYKERHRSMEKNIGEFVVLRKDTLQVIDVSMFNYVLEDGTEIDEFLLSKIKVKR